MADKHIQLKIHTGNGNFDELFPVTKAELVEVNGKKLSESLNEVTAQLAQTKLDFETAVSEITVDSEVLLTHNSATKNKTFSTLDSRLEEIESDNKLKANKTQENWITPTLLNGATSVSGYPLEYMKDNMGVVHFKGKLIIPSYGRPTIQLPIGYAPPVHADFLCSVERNKIGRMLVQTSGIMYPSFPYDVNSEYDLSGISFKV